MYIHLPFAMGRWRTVLRRRRVWGATLSGAFLTGALAAAPAAAAATPSIALPDPVAVAGTTGVVQAVEGGQSPSGAQCRDYYFPVKESESWSTTFKVYAQLCTRTPLTDHTPVQILLPGGSYNHTYWDWPYRPDTYSYVKAATSAGFATLNVDRLGYGNSDHPNPLTLDFQVAGYVTHQLVGYLRDGALGVRFRQVVLNGHSMGGITAQREASAYHDVDAVIVSGIGHDFAPKGILQVADKFYPAELDPKFGLAKGWLPGYLTTLPGNRVATFVAPAAYDPGIAAVEEANKDTLSTTELTAITLDSYNPTITEGITVPVLYALGQHDLIWCPTTEDCNTDPQAHAEHTFYTPAAQFEEFVVPGSAHSINVTKAAPVFYAKTLSWLHGHGIG